MAPRKLTKSQMDARDERKRIKKRKEDRKKRYESGVGKLGSIVQRHISEMALERFFNSYRSRPSSLKYIRMVGLDGAGKSTILREFQMGEVVTTIPAIGFQVEKVERNCYNFTVWDVGGEERFRPLWRPYFQNTQALIFVVDSNDHERIGEAQEELQKMLQEDELRDAVLLVFANKQDLPNAMNAAELTDKLGLRMLQNRRWFIEKTSTIDLSGLRNGLWWLYESFRE